MINLPYAPGPALRPGFQAIRSPGTARDETRFERASFRKINVLRMMIG
jgi:hypothetical protein